VNFSVDDRVIDKISEQAGTVKDLFMNQVIVLWDVPDEAGNFVSSVPTDDLIKEKTAAELQLDGGTESTLC
jgi:hypothetical protein